MSTTDVGELSQETAPGVVYDRYLANGQLVYQRCEEFDHVIFYPRVLCPVCGSGSLSWHVSNGTGTVYAVTALHPRDSAAYNVSLVDLDEGFRMMTNVVGVDATEVTIGARVRLQIDTAAETPLPLFVLDGDAR
jgi:uncharacterized OB-fold protein